MKRESGRFLTHVIYRHPSRPPTVKLGLGELNPNDRTARPSFGGECLRANKADSQKLAYGVQDTRENSRGTTDDVVLSVSSVSAGQVQTWTCIEKERKSRRSTQIGARGHVVTCLVPGPTGIQARCARNDTRNLCFQRERGKIFECTVPPREPGIIFTCANCNIPWPRQVSMSKMRWLS